MDCIDEIFYPPWSPMWIAHIVTTAMDSIVRMPEVAALGQIKFARKVNKLKSAFSSNRTHTESLSRPN